MTTEQTRDTAFSVGLDYNDKSNQAPSRNFSNIIVGSHSTASPPKR